VAPDAGAAIPDAGAAADGGGAEATGGSGDGGCDSSGDAPGTGLLGLLVLGLGLIRRR
jgi:uncharacterized protein (TIGR03382 family)